MECSCCGEERDDSMVASLLCHDDIKVCRVCVGWLQQRVGGIDVTPTLPVADMDEAVRFCESAGFDVQRYDDGFAFVHLNDQSVFDLDLIVGMVPSANHAGCNMITDNVGEWHGRLVAAGLKVSSIEEMPWGMHEFTLTDPGNNIRVGRNRSNDCNDRLMEIIGADCGCQADRGVIVTPCDAYPGCYCAELSVRHSEPLNDGEEPSG